MIPRRLVVGLGNPGPAYDGTRHNLGFALVERLRARMGAQPERDECGARVSEAGELLLARPSTYMNRSGYAVRCLLELHQLQLDALLVAYDDVALPLGRLRLRPRGGPGGHRGMESVVESVRGEGFARLRLGIAPADGVAADGDLASFVLSPFAASEIEAVEGMLERAADAVGVWIAEGAEAAMNRFNAGDLA